MRLNTLNSSIESLQHALETCDNLVIQDFGMPDETGYIGLYSEYLEDGEYIYTLESKERVIFALLCLASENIYY